MIYVWNFRMYKRICQKLVASNWIQLRWVSIFLDCHKISWVQCCSKREHLQILTSKLLIPANFVLVRLDTFFFGLIVVHLDTYFKCVIHFFASSLCWGLYLWRNFAQQKGSWCTTQYVPSNYNEIFDIMNLLEDRL